MYFKINSELPNCGRDNNGIKYFMWVPPFPSLFAGGYWLFCPRTMSKVTRVNPGLTQWKDDVQFFNLSSNATNEKAACSRWCGYELIQLCYPRSLSMDNTHTDHQRHILRKINFVWLSPWHLDIITTAQPSLSWLNHIFKPQLL